MTELKSDSPERTFEELSQANSTTSDEKINNAKNSSSADEYSKAILSESTKDDERSVLALSDDEKDKEIEKMATEMGINHKKLMMKIDFYVVPPFILLYFLAFLDRVNISNAKVYGMEDELGLHGNQFNTALTIFFVPYVFFEVLSNYLMKIDPQVLFRDEQDISHHLCTLGRDQHWITKTYNHLQDCENFSCSTMILYIRQIWKQVSNACLYQYHPLCYPSRYLHTL